MCLLPPVQLKEVWCIIHKAPSNGRYPHRHSYCTQFVLNSCGNVCGYLHALIAKPCYRIYLCLKSLMVWYPRTTIPKIIVDILLIRFQWYIYWACYCYMITMIMWIKKTIWNLVWQIKNKNILQSRNLWFSYDSYIDITRSFLGWKKDSHMMMYLLQPLQTKVLKPKSNCLNFAN